jgi:hypothetical protein
MKLLDSDKVRIRTRIERFCFCGTTAQGLSSDQTAGGNCNGRTRSSSSNAALDGAWFPEHHVITGVRPGPGGRPPAEFFQNVGKLALTEAAVKKISFPVKVAVGDRDPVNRLYGQPLKRVRDDWPVIEIRDAGHINCVVKEQFRKEIVDWVKAKTSR